MKYCLLLIILMFSNLLLSAQDFAPVAPEGFGEATTGGGNTNPMTVTTYSQLKNALKLNSPQVILVSGVINIPEGQGISEIVTNKSIIGLSGATLINTSQTKSGSGILNLRNGSKNVIIRNLILESAGAFDIDGRDNLTSDGCVNLWVDHCEFRDGVDGNFDIRGDSDNVTVSWCKFTYLKPPTSGGSGGSNDHRFSNLVGSSDDNAPQDGRYSITFQNCYWAEGCRERMPRARNAELHIVNCLYSTDVSSSRAIGMSGGINGATCYVEKTDFERIGTVYQGYGGSVAINFENCLKGRSNIGQVDKPSYEYSSYNVNDVSQILKDDDCGAGAKLVVTQTGEISSNCTTAGVSEVTSAGFRVYPTIVKDILTIAFVEKELIRSSLSIFSLDGKKIFSFNMEPLMDKTLNVDMSPYPSGIYLGKIFTSNGVKIFKVIKN